MNHELLQFKSRFAMHLAAALAGRLPPDAGQLAGDLETLAACLDGPQANLAAAQSRLPDLLQHWMIQRPAMTDDLASAIDDALRELVSAVGQIDGADADRFIGPVFRCRDRVMKISGLSPRA